jgi:hypothetical protein
LEHARPGTIAAPLARLQDELTNRRQYILFVHQLQHEVSESLELVINTRTQVFTYHSIIVYVPPGPPTHPFASSVSIHSHSILMLV